MRTQKLFHVRGQAALLMLAIKRFEMPVVGDS